MMFYRLMAVAALLAGWAMSPSAGARPPGLLGISPEEVRAPDSLIDRRNSSRMTASQAAQEAQRRYGGGKVLSVDSTGEGFRVKLLRNGDVRVVFIGDR